ncbi:hypothetical protein, partial [Rhizobium leguminosarum]|uniref:hypothetical protein n=1 Tax=Rhizobium leguminosarum TaxID=384 RepID=UPI003F9CB2F1
LSVIWIAKLNSENGSIIWLSEFKVGHRLSTSGLSYANGSFYVLGETNRIIPLRFKKYHGKTKLEIFKESEGESRLLLLSVSANGNLN